MTTYTDLEKKVYNALIDIVEYEFSADLTDLSESTGLTEDTVKGVIGSLVKKGKVDTDEEIRGGKRFVDIFPALDSSSFLCDNYEENQIQGFKL
jgi:predicted transcriptional regulator